MSTRRSLLPCLLVIACQSASSTGRNPDNARPVAAQSKIAGACATELVISRLVRGVIFPETCASAISPRHLPEEPVVGYFRPTPGLIRTLEARLRPALERGRTEPRSLVRIMPGEHREEIYWYVRSSVEYILEHFSKYRRQYAGIVAPGGVRRVIVNSFPELGFPDGTDDHPHWRERWMDDVDDGAELYWRIQYDMVSGKFIGFEINPSG